MFYDFHVIYYEMYLYTASVCFSLGLYNLLVLMAVLHGIVNAYMIQLRLMEKLGCGEIVWNICLYAQPEKQKTNNDVKDLPSLKELLGG